MTRTTDDMHEPERFKGLGERVTPPAPAPAPAPKPQGPSGFVTDPDGRMKTTTHTPRFP